MGEVSIEKKGGKRMGKVGWILDSQFEITEIVMLRAEIENIV